MRRFTIWVLTLIMLFTLAGSALAREAAQPQSAWRNYILVIDNSLSTSQDTKIGPATDVDGLRFSAANALFGNADETSRIGVVVFCGADNCYSYGPVEHGSSAAGQLVGQYLNKNANIKRDVYTDIGHALSQAKSMAESFPDGETSIILLTDGVNDLTNSQSPLTDSENLQANENTIQVIRSIRSLPNTKFYAVALTSEGASANRDIFMNFVNRMAEAGGGKLKDDGTLDNVLEAKAETLTESFLAILGINTGNKVITVVDKTPIYQTFTVPYDGITDATITIAFTPSDKQHLDEIKLTDPSGNTYLVWDHGQCQKFPGVEVLDDSSFVLVKAAQPQTGDWLIEVIGAQGIVIRTHMYLNNSVSLQMGTIGTVQVGNPFILKTWFQKHQNNAFFDITDPAIYQQSQATLLLLPPDNSEHITMEMQQGDNCFEKEITLDKPGSWIAQVTVQNSILEKTLENYRLDVGEKAAVVPISGIQLNVSPQKPLNEPGLFLDRDAEQFTFTWSVDGEYESALASVCQADTGLPVFEQMLPSTEIPAHLFENDTDYKFIVKVIPKNGSDADLVRQELSFRLYPEEAVLSDFILEIPDLAPQSGVYHPDSDITTAQWSIQGDVDHFNMTLTDPDGKQTTASLPASQRSYRLSMSKDGQHTFSLVAVPKYGSDETAGQYLQEINIVPRIPTFLERYGLLLIIVVVLLIAAVVAFFIVRSAMQPKMTGNLSIQIKNSPVPFFEQFEFDPKQKSKLLIQNVPMAKHPRMAALKTENEIAYQLLSGLRLSMDKTSETGELIAEGTQVYTPDTDVIVITKGADESGFVGQWFVVCGQPAKVLTLVGPDGAEYLVSVCFNSSDGGWGGSGGGWA